MQDPNKPKSTFFKEFKLTTVSVKNRTTVFVLTFIVVILGVTSYITLPKETYPEVEIPTIYIGTIHPGNSPVDIENLITRPIEKELNTISEADNIKSVSVQDYSTIIVEFTTGTLVSDGLVKVKDAVDKAKPELPGDLEEEPNVFEINFSEFPILNINLSGNYTLEELNDYAEYIKEEIEKFSQISKVEIRGVDEREVKINANPHAMEARQVNFGDIEDAVRSENVTLSGGNVLSEGIRRSTRVLGEFDDPYQLEDIVVKQEEGNIVYLKDIATVDFDYKEKQNYARLEREPVVMVDVVKRSGENLLVLTEKIYQALDQAKAEVFPADLKVTITNDQSEWTRKMVSNLENNIIFGVILVVLVLLFFLGTRNALFVGIAIPLSMFVSFMILGALGITINMMVLFSLIMALGMLVDNGIVVVENVYRLMEEGLQPIQATIRGVSEVALPVIASTATTLAAFLPLAFWPGIMGEFMKYLPITLIITLGSSLFVALIINPVLVSSFMRVDQGLTLNHRKLIRNNLIVIAAGAFFLMVKIFVLGNLMILLGLIVLMNVYILSPLSRRFRQYFLPWLENSYVKILRFALMGYRPAVFLIATVVALFGSVVLMGILTPKVIFFPINQPKMANIFIEFPIGGDIEVTNSFTEEIEEKVMAIIEPYQYMVESVTANVGQGTADPSDIFASQSDSPHRSRITVNFVDFEYRRGIKTSDVLEDIRDGIKGYPGVTITVDKDAAGPPVGKPISIEVSGEDYPTLIALTERMKNFIVNSGIEGIEKLKTDLETGKPELIVDIDREKARRFGLSTWGVANEIRTSLFGKEISKFKQGEDDYEIQLRLSDQFRYDIDALMNKNITFRDQVDGKMHQVPISAVARAQLSSTLGSVKRKDMDRLVTLSSNVRQGFNATEINDQIKELLADFKIPPGYEVKFTGEQEKQAEELAFLSRALMIAIFIIFLIIVAQFNKVTAPFIIMTSVIFSTIGVFLGLVIFQMDFVIIMTMIGIISLAGVVVNNAIVLIDFIELIRRRRREDLNVDHLPLDEIVNSIVHAGKTRLRPVLLTAITTILGLIPLAVGINFDFVNFFSQYEPDFYIGGDNVIFWGPMSWTIIFGLSFATFLTLVIVPVMYILTDRLNHKLGLSRH